MIVQTFTFECDVCGLVQPERHSIHPGASAYMPVPPSGWLLVGTLLVCDIHEVTVSHYAEKCVYINAPDGSWRREPPLP